MSERFLTKEQRSAIHRIDGSPGVFAKGQKEWAQERIREENLQGEELEQLVEEIQRNGHRHQVVQQFALKDQQVKLGKKARQQEQREEQAKDLHHQIAKRREVAATDCG